MLEINNYYLGDNLPVLSKIDDESVDLFYIDPPFATNRDFGDFSDKWSNPSIFCKELMIPRLEIIKNKLKPTGNVVLHCDISASHYLKVALDNIFGLNNFKNEIIWVTGGNAKTKFKLYKTHDSLLVYSKTSRSKFYPLYKPYDAEYYKKNAVKFCEIHGKEYVSCAIHCSQPDVVPRPNLRYEWNNHQKQWLVTKNRMKILHDENRLVYSSSGIPRIKRFLDEMDGVPIKDVWDDINSLQGAEKLGYATQKPIKLLERIILLYTLKGDLVVDCFAGSGTTGRACIKLGRNYILMDLSSKGKKIFQASIKSNQTNIFN